MWFCCPKGKIGLSEKFMLQSRGPMKVTKRINLVNCVLREKPNTKQFVVHADRMRKFHGESPSYWLDKLHENQSSEAIQDKQSSRVAQNSSPARAEFAARARAVGESEEASHQGDKKSVASTPDKSVITTPDFFLSHSQPDRAKAGCHGPQPKSRSQEEVTSSHASVEQHRVRPARTRRRPKRLVD